MNNQTQETLKIPMIALRGLVVFPNSTVHFDVGRKRSAAALDLAIKKGTPVFLVTQRDVRHDDPDLGELYDIGTIAVIKQVLRISDDNIRVLVEGFPWPHPGAGFGKTVPPCHGAVHPRAAR